MASVILNRRQHKNFPKDICHIISQPGQFSFWPKPLKFDKESFEIALDAIEGKIEDITNGALYFTNTRVRPKWKKKSITTIGNHRFYR